MINEHTLKSLNKTALQILANDARSRIISNSAGGNPNEAYIQKQENYIKTIQEELNKREVEGDGKH